jgi:hypothetical protein
VVPLKSFSPTRFPTVTIPSPAKIHRFPSFFPLQSGSGLSPVFTPELGREEMVSFWETCTRRDIGARKDLRRWRGGTGHSSEGSNPTLDPSCSGPVAWGDGAVWHLKFEERKLLSEAPELRETNIEKRKNTDQGMFSSQISERLWCKQDPISKVANYVGGEVPRHPRRLPATCTAWSQSGVPPPSAFPKAEWLG